MALVINTVQQIIIMFEIILIGILCYRLKILDSVKNKVFSEVLLKVVTPALVISSFQSEFTKELLHGLLMSLGLAVISYGISIFLPTVLIRPSKDYDYIIGRFTCMYSNCGYIGIPLVYGIFGKEGVFYITSFSAVFNILVYTHGASIMNKENFKFSIKRMISPAIVGVILGLIFFLCQIRLPYLLLRPMEMLADMNTPLAMLVAGVSIAQTNVRELIKDRRIMKFSLMKLILIPGIFVLVCRMLPLPYTVMMTAVLATACPSAAIVILFSLKYGRNDVYASEIFTETTILSIVTIPLMVAMATV